MIIAILFTVVLFVSKQFSSVPMESAISLIGAIDFEMVLMDVMLGFLLFAGAMHTNFDQLKVQRWPVLVFATLGVLCSTFLVGFGVWLAFGWIGLNPKFIHCLLFKQARVPKKLETKIVGESLFNDGVGVVVFLTIFNIATGGQMPGHDHHEADDHHAHVQQIDSSDAHYSQPSAVGPKDSLTNVSLVDAEHSHGDAAHTDGHDSDHGHAPGVLEIAKLFVVEVGGGILLGLILGYGTFQLLRSIDDYEIEVMITLACVMGGCSLAQYL